MGTWDVGPFDNDTAADWCGELHDAPGAERPLLIRKALEAVVEESDYLDGDFACEAIAAAAVVVSQRGGPPVTSAYAPDFLLEGGRVEVSEETAVLAARALDRVTGDESEWRALWEDAGMLPDALAALRPIREALIRVP